MLRRCNYSICNIYVQTMMKQWIGLQAKTLGHQSLSSREAQRNTPSFYFLLESALTTRVPICSVRENKQDSKGDGKELCAEHRGMYYSQQNDSLCAQAYSRQCCFIIEL